MSNPQQPAGQPPSDVWQSPGGHLPQSGTAAPPAAPTAYGYGPATGTAPAYAGWGSRVGSALLDALLPLGIIMLAGALGGVISAAAGGDSPPTLVLALGYLVAVAVGIWNTAFRQGRTGQSLGKSALGTRLVGAHTGRPVGAGMAFVRGLAHVLDSLPLYIGYLWPLWDAKRQTFADKVCSTVVVKG